MSHDKKHPGHDSHHNQPPRFRPIHHRWYFWVAVILMLGCMIYYVMSLDLALGPGQGQKTPAAAP